MGPSGAGKDSVLAWLHAGLPATSPVHWARRTITRAVQDGGELHETLELAQFEAVARAGGFAMHWRAHDLRYGIRREQLQPLREGRWVVVNGSRAYFEEALRCHPGLVAVHVTAPSQMLLQRLSARGRESPAQIRARIARARMFRVPAGAIEVRNDGPLEDVARALLRSLRERCDWPG